MDKEKAVNILMDMFSSVYCDDCRYNFEQKDDNSCDYCVRKSMGWALSKEFAEYIVNKLEIQSIGTSISSNYF